MINTLVKSSEGDVAGAAEDLGKGSSWGIIVIGAIDIVKYYTNPDKHKEFSDLIVNILGDVVKCFVAAALVIGTILITAYVGSKLDKFENKSGLHDALIGMGRKCEDFLKKNVPSYDTSILTMLAEELSAY